MHFHDHFVRVRDHFVRGCDGSMLIDSTPGNIAERDSPINNPSLKGAFEVIYKAKATLETLCNGTVPCADTLAFAARDSIEITGGFSYQVPAGRRDGRISLASETFTNLPPPIFNDTQLTQQEMVNSLRAHTIGRAHCISLNDRLYNFKRTGQQDPSLDSTYATVLKHKCPQHNNDAAPVVPMDSSTPTLTDVGYYYDVPWARVTTSLKE